MSVCEIAFDRESRALEITHRIFLDDLEETLKSWSGDEKVDVMNPKDEDELQRLIGEYLLEKFAMTINGKEAELNFLGAEAEDDVMYCYIELLGIKKLKSITLTNTILMDKFDDQTNMVHIYRDKETTSSRFTAKSNTFEKKFD